MGQTAANVTIFDVREVDPQRLQLLALALEGGEVVIAKDNIPLARLVLISYPSNRRVANLHKGAMRLQPDFNAPVVDLFGLDAT